MQKGIPALRQARYESISDLPGIQKSYREKAALSISGDTTSNEDMCNVERRAKSSGVNSGSARTVKDTATPHATVFWTSGLARTQAAISQEEATR